MAQCKICGQWDGKHLSNCPNYKGETTHPGDPIDQEKEYCSECGELLPNHKTTCSLYGSGVIPDDKSICVNCGKLTSVSIFNDFKCENCGKSAVEVEDEPPTTSEPIRGVGDKMCTNKDIYEFADSSRPSPKNKCPSKRQWNNNYLGRWILSIDDHIKDNQLFALKNVVKELRPIDLVMNFDITSSRDADNLIFDLEIVNKTFNSDLLTKYTKNGNIEIYGYYVDKSVNSWRYFKCTYQYSNETSDQFRFKETEITKSKQNFGMIQQPDNIDSWIESIYLDGRIVYNSNYPISFTDPTTNNLINLTVKISYNAVTPDANPIIMEINAGSSLTPKANVYLNKSDVKVKNPALYSCTAYIQYNGSIGERMNGSTDGRFREKGKFQSTYKLSYDPKTPDDSTLSVEQLSFDIYMQDGSRYLPNINDIIVLYSGDVKINKFESQLSTFDSMKLYYPVWSEPLNKYNMGSITAPLEQIF